MAETITQAQSGAVPLTEDMYTKKGVDELIATVRKGGITPKGSSAFASLPTPAAENLGWMFNVTDAFTTTSAFVEGAGKSFPAGTNVYVCNPSGSTYKWDVLPGEGPQPGTSAPAADGTAAVGTSAKFAREDHVHPTDTTRAAASALTSHTGNTTAHVTAAERTAWNAKQAKITASGLLKGDGTGAVIAATAGTDYVAPSALSGYVPTTRKVNGKELSADITLSASDVGAASSGHSHEITDVNGLAGALDAVDNSATTANTNASAALTRLSAIETAAGTLLTNLSAAAVSDAAMTNANTIKTAVLTLIDFLKAFAAASDNDNSTSHSAS